MKYLLIIVILIIGFGCPQLDDNCISDYMFWIPISVIPNKEEYKVGDTITVSMTNDNTYMFDSLNEEHTRQVNFPDFDPNAWFLCPMLDTLPVLDGFQENILLIDNKYNVLNQFLSGERVTGIFFLEIDTSELVSKLDFKVVLNKPGTYALYSVSELWRNSKEICFPNKCSGCGYGRGSILGYFVYDGEIHENILTEKNKEVEDYVWKDRWGQREESSPYYFRVVK